MGNFGYLVDNDTNEIVGAAPIFDNGYGLFSLATYRPDTPEYHEFDDLRKYLNRVGPALYDRWLDYPEKLTTELLSKLTALQGFQFKRHKHYNLADDRLSAIEAFIQKRVGDILEHGKRADHLLMLQVPSVGIKSTKSDSLEYQILENMKADKAITAAEIADILQVEQRTIERRIKLLREQGKVVRVGSRKTGYWQVKD